MSSEHHFLNEVFLREMMNDSMKKMTEIVIYYSELKKLIRDNPKCSCHGKEILCLNHKAFLKDTGEHKNCLHLELPAINPCRRTKLKHLAEKTCKYYHIPRWTDDNEWELYMSLNLPILWGIELEKELNRLTDGFLRFLETHDGSGLEIKWPRKFSKKNGYWELPSLEDQGIRIKVIEG